MVDRFYGDGTSALIPGGLQLYRTGDSVGYVVLVARALGPEAALVP